MLVISAFVCTCVFSYNKSKLPKSDFGPIVLSDYHKNVLEKTVSVTQIEHEELINHVIVHNEELKKDVDEINVFITSDYIEELVDGQNK